jgi:hypothetical protein
MRLRSTGLGRTELEGEVIAIKKVDDLVIFFVNTSKPVKWRTRMGFQERDLRDLVWAIIKPGNMWFIIKAVLFGPKKNPQKVEF